MPSVTAADILTFDRILAVVGFVIAIWQLRKTRTAAEAAKTSAANAISAIRRLAAATKMHEIASRSRELLRLLRTKTMAPAASAAFELRDSVARYRHDFESRRLISDERWSQAIADVRSVHERLESLAMTGKASTPDREALLHEVSRLHTMFAELAAQASTEGLADAHTE
jgi:hypothetical protein